MPIVGLRFFTGQTIGNAAESLSSGADLTQQRTEIEIDPSSCNLFDTGIVLVERATGNADFPARWLDVCEGAAVHRFKTPFHPHEIPAMRQCLDRVHVARKPDDERPHELVSNRDLALESARRKLNDDGIGIVGENLVFVRAFPGIEVLVKKRTHSFWRCLHNCRLHIGSLLDGTVAESVRIEISPTPCRRAALAGKRS